MTFNTELAISYEDNKFKVTLNFLGYSVSGESTDLIIAFNRCLINAQKYIRKLSGENED